MRFAREHPEDFEDRIEGFMDRLEREIELRKDAMQNPPDKYAPWRYRPLVHVDPRDLRPRHGLRKRHVLLRLFRPNISHSGDFAVYLWRLPNGDLLLFDGHHRTASYKIRRRRQIPARIVNLVESKYPQLEAS